MSKTLAREKKQTRPIDAPEPADQADSQGRWSADEETRLVALAEKSESWPKIARQFPGKSAAVCQAKWQEILKRESKKGNWTPEEDELLRKWVCSLYLGAGSWSCGVDFVRTSHHRAKRQTVQRAVG